MRHLLVLSLALALAACSKKKPDTIATSTSDGTPRPAGTARTDGGPGTATITPVGPGADQVPGFGAIYFEFDSTTLSQAARDTLGQLGTWLTAHPSRVVIEGHADDRGTTEYNIALGQRRAQVIAEYLARLGVAAANLDTISYGEERPAADGDNDEAWALNRRGELHPR